MKLLKEGRNFWISAAIDNSKKKKKLEEKKMKYKLGLKKKSLVVGCIFFVGFYLI